MTITDKTRKMLWGKSGNCCAICKQKLVIKKTDLDTESVVGDECHIISGTINGPRYLPNVPPIEIDIISNLLLLCRVHHKMVDDQSDTYTVEKLKNIKSDHENWVESKLKEKEEIPPLKIRRFKNEIPTHLPLITSGRDLFNLATQCDCYYDNYSDDLTNNEVEIIGSFLQNLHDLVDISSVLEPIDKVRATKFLDDEIKEVNKIDFLVFAGIENQRLEGGVGSSSKFKAMHISIIRKNDLGIIPINEE